MDDLDREERIVILLSKLLAEEKKVRNDLRTSKDNVASAEQALEEARNALHSKAEESTHQLEEIHRCRQQIFEMYHKGEELPDDDDPGLPIQVAIKPEPKSEPETEQEPEQEQNALSDHLTPFSPSLPRSQSVYQHAATSSSNPVQLGEYLENCPSIVYDGHGWTEIRCHLCGTNTNDRGQLMKNGLTGVKLHLAGKHNVGRLSDREVLRLCRYRDVSDEEARRIEGLEEDELEEAVPLIRLKRER